MGDFILVKRWRLREGGDEAALLGLVRDEIAPHYATLSPDVRLGLWRLEETRSYLAIQRWTSRAAREDATQSPAYGEWLCQYAPLLERWDALMAFEEEWTVASLLE